MLLREKFCYGPLNFVKRAARGFVVLIFLASCHGCSKVAAEKGGPGSIIRLALSEDPLTLDPALITDVTSGALSAKIFDGLVQFDLKGNIQPCLAQKWEVHDSGKEYVFTLRDNAFFHNGRPVTSEDVKKSFQRILDPATGSPRRWVLQRVSRIQTPDERTVRITLDRPFAPFLSLLAMPNAAVIPTEEVARWGQAFGQHPVGTGPFVLERWERDKILVLKKNPSYFAGPPGVDGVQYRIIPEPWAALTEFTQGKLDWIAIPSSHMEQFLSDPALVGRLKNNVGLNTYYLGFNCGKPPLDRVRVRQALAMAIDREKIVQRLLKRRAIPASGPVPPVLDPIYSTVPAPSYDPGRARQWLKEEGAGNLSLTLYQASSLDALEIMEVVQHYLAKVGVKVQIVQREWSSFKEAVVKGEPDMFFLSWWADYPDPENFLFPNFFSANQGAGGNKSRYADPLFDRMILDARNETDGARRDQLYLQCVRRIVDQCPWVFLWHRTEWVVAQPWVQGMELGFVYNADKFTTVRLEGRCRLRAE